MLYRKHGTVFLKGCLTTFCCFLLWTGPRAHKCTLVQANLIPLRQGVGDLVANAGRSTRKNHQGKPQSPCFLYGINKNYACTGQGARARFRSFDPQRHGGGSNAARCYAACRSGKGFLPTGNQQLIRVFFLGLELVIPLRHRLWGSHAAIFLTTSTS